MAEATKLPVKTEKSATSPASWTPFESLRREVDRLFDDFDGGFFRPFRRSVFDFVPAKRPTAPAVDFTDSDNAYELTAELPGIDEKNVEVKVANGVLTIKGEKQEEKDREEEGLLSA
jgi:HSP20 family protein